MFGEKQVIMGKNKKNEYKEMKRMIKVTNVWNSLGVHVSVMVINS